MAPKKQKMNVNKKQTQKNLNRPIIQRWADDGQFPSSSSPLENLISLQLFACLLHLPTQSAYLPLHTTSHLPTHFSRWPTKADERSLKKKYIKKSKHLKVSDLGTAHDVYSRVACHQHNETRHDYKLVPTPWCWRLTAPACAPLPQSTSMHMCSSECAR